MTKDFRFSICDMPNRHSAIENWQSPIGGRRSFVGGHFFLQEPLWNTDGFFFRSAWAR